MSPRIMMNWNFFYFKSFLFNFFHQLHTNNQREWALSVLGLESNATTDDIKNAYRRLCNQHHPDRFIKLGTEAVAAANVIFARINEAHDILVNA